MSRVARILVAAAVVALLAAAAGYASSTSPKQRDSSVAVQAHRGGTMKLLAKSAGGTLDPQVNYTLQYWQLYQATYDGLLAFKKAGGQRGVHRRARPRRGDADADQRRQDLRFKLRKGIKFSNGKEVTPTDVVASFQRIFKVKSPTAGSFYAGIVGADACLKTAGDLHAARAA